METILQQMINGDINQMTTIGFALVAAFVGAASGCIGAEMVGGKFLGKELVMMMGAPFGAMASVPGVLIGLLILGLK
ncbi:MAG: hypothetical protein DKT66_13810 [Candidatus Melainabacteria bacterium]|nr:MAG: hypothetical protein DKT66_13810 [Candidatus Melainabacteria bacterium]